MQYTIDDALKDQRIAPHEKIYASGKKTRDFLASCRGVTVPARTHCIHDWTIQELFELKYDCATLRVRSGIDDLRNSYLDGSIWSNIVAWGATLPEYVENVWKILNGEKRPKNEMDVVKTRMGLGNSAEELTLEDSGKLLGLTRERVRLVEKALMETLFSGEFSALFRPFIERVEKIFLTHGGFLSRHELCESVDHEFGWQGTTWFSANKLINLTASNNIVSDEDEQYFAWNFQAESMDYLLFKSIVGRIGRTKFAYADIAEEMQEGRPTGLSLSQYEFYVRRLIADGYVGDDSDHPVWEVFASIYGMRKSDVAERQRVMKAVFENGSSCGHIFTKQELLEECKRQAPEVSWSMGRVSARINAGDLPGGLQILRYNRGRRNESESTYTLDCYVSEVDKQIARETVREIAEYLKNTGHAVVSVFKFYENRRKGPKVSVPQLCFYELIRMYGKGIVNCQEYPRVASIDVPYCENAYGQEVRRSFLRQGNKMVSTQVLKKFLVEELGIDPELSGTTIKTMGFARSSDSTGGVIYVLE